MNQEKNYRLDLLVNRKFVGEKKYKYLSEIGMHTYGDLHDYQDIHKLPTWLKTIYKQTQNIEELPTRPATDTINFLDYENPYLQRYGVN